MRSTRHILLAVLLPGLISCTPIREAQEVVAEADSLRATGVLYADSTAMADAAATLERVRFFYPTDYAHANYYYGRILREHGNQPEAMLAFLRVVHSRTKDHAIKGRSYCNIGIMCGLATEHELAYDMYERSAEEFLKAQDSIAYFYALNDMALELASCNKTEEALSILNDVYQRAISLDLLSYTALYKAIAYKIAQQYDSALLYADIELNHFRKEPAGSLVKAQAFDNLGQKDSALYYAEQVMRFSLDWNDQYNALYILSHANPDLSNDSILSLTSQRADLGKLQEERQGFLSQATQLLLQDLNRKPDLRWLFAIIFTIVIIGIVLSMYVKRKRRKHQLISQQVEKAKEEHRNLSEQNKRLQSVHSEYEEKVKNGVEHFCQRIKSDSNPQAVISWDNYSQMRRIVNENLYNLADKLEELGLAEHEIRFCVLVLLQFNRKECAQWMNLGVSSMGGKKRDIAIKLGQTSSTLYDYLLSLALK